MDDNTLTCGAGGASGAGGTITGGTLTGGCSIAGGGTVCERVTL